jgi:hypothetical protein
MRARKLWHARCAIEHMEWRDVKADWHAHRAEVARRWQCLNERELDEIAGDRQRLVSCIQEVYGISADEADRQICDWETGMQSWDPSSADGPPPLEPGQVAAGSEGAASQPGSEKLVATGTWPSEPQGKSMRTSAPHPGASASAEPGVSEDDAAACDAGNPILSEHLRHVGYMDDENASETSESARPADSPEESGGSRRRGKTSQQ